jgi:feruloyl esterase
MQNIRLAIGSIVFLVFAALVGACANVKDTPAFQEDLTVTQMNMACSFGSLPKFPDVRITSVTQETAPVPHCKVAGVIGTETNFELLLPDDWNGKFAMGGGGGFAGQVINTALAYGALQSGYATAGTDTGHAGHPVAADWAHNNLERLVSFGHQAVHRTAVNSKALINAYYQKDITNSYFTGCSRGGGQALMEAQRYPADFDGIVAGAPAYNWTDGLAAGTTTINRAMYPDPKNLQEAVIRPQDQQLIESAYLKQCDALDGLEDGILSDPRECSFDVAALTCKSGQSNDCLTTQQVLAAKAVYDGPSDDHGQIFPGFPYGGETTPGGWSRWLTGGLKYNVDEDSFQGGVEVDADNAAPELPSVHYGFGNGIMKYFIYNDPDWNYLDYDMNDLRPDSERVAQTLNADDPDLSAFRDRGGKLLMYTGWTDPAITALGTIQYYAEVLEHDESAAEDVRLIMMPGVDHCFGGIGPDWVNYLDEIDKWVTTGDAPEQTTAFWLNEQFQPDGSRPVCAYPKYVKYSGTGDTRDASNFSCVQSE